VSSSVLTLILAGGEGERLSILSQVRAKPGVPFGGKYRIIDFALSNTVNSGLTDVGILTQYAPRSLIDHIGVGRPWDLDRSRGGVALLQPFIGRGRARDWYRGTADAVLQNLDFIADRTPELVLVLAGDHVYKMDYRPFIEMHRESGAEVTCAVRTVPIEEAHRFGILDVARDGRVTAFIEKPANPPSNLVSMGVYVFSWPAMRDLLSPDRVDFGRDVLPWMVEQGRRVFAQLVGGGHPRPQRRGHPPLQGIARERAELLEHGVERGAVHLPQLDAQHLEQVPVAVHRGGSPPLRRVHQSPRHVESDGALGGPRPRRDVDRHGGRGLEDGAGEPG